MKKTVSNNVLIVWKEHVATKRHPNIAIIVVSPDFLLYELSHPDTCVRTTVQL